MTYVIFQISILWVWSVIDQISEDMQQEVSQAKCEQDKNKETTRRAEMQNTAHKVSTQSN